MLVCRVTHSDFLARFGNLRPKLKSRMKALANDKAAQCLLLLSDIWPDVGYLGPKQQVNANVRGATTLSSKAYEIGRTKVYFSNGILETLENIRGGLIHAHVTMIQKSFRRFVVRRWFVAVRAQCVAIQACMRRVIYSHRYKRLKSAVFSFQRYVRQFLSKKFVTKLRIFTRASQIQSTWRMRKHRRVFVHLRKHAVTVIEWWKSKCERKRYFVRLAKWREDQELSRKLAVMAQELEAERAAREVAEAETRAKLEAERREAEAELERQHQIELERFRIESERLAEELRVQAELEARRKQEAAEAEAARHLQQLEEDARKAAEVEASLHEVEAQRAELEARWTDLATQAENLEARAQQAELECLETTKLLAEAEARAEKAEDDAREAEKLAVQVETKAAEAIQRAKEEADKLRTPDDCMVVKVADFEAMKAQVAELTTKNDAFEVEVGSLQNNLRTQETESKTALEQANKQWESELTVYSERLATAREALQTKEEELEQVLQELESLTDKHVSLASAHSSKEAGMGSLMTELTGLKQEHAEQLKALRESHAQHAADSHSRAEALACELSEARQLHHSRVEQLEEALQEITNKYNALTNVHEGKEVELAEYVADSSSKLEAMTAELAEARQSHQAKVEQLEEALQDLTNKHSELTSANAATELQLAQLMADSKVQVDALAQELTEARQSHYTTVRQLEETLQEVTSKHSTLTRTRSVKEMELGQYVADSRSKVDALITELGEYRQSQRQQVEQLEQALVELTSQHAALTSSHAAKEFEIEVLSTELNGLKQAQEKGMTSLQQSHSQRVTDLQSNVDSLTQELEDVRRSLQSKENELEQVLQDLEELTNRHSSLSSAHTSKEFEFDVLVAELNGFKQAHSKQLEMLHQNHTRQLSDSHAEVGTLTQELSLIRTHSQSLSEKQDDHEQQLADKQDEVEGLTAEVTELRVGAQALSEQVQQLQQQLRQQAQQAANANSTPSKRQGELFADLVELTAKVELLTNENKQLKQQLAVAVANAATGSNHLANGKSPGSPVPQVDTHVQPQPVVAAIGANMTMTSPVGGVRKMSPVTSAGSGSGSAVAVTKVSNVGIDIPATSPDILSNGNGAAAAMSPASIASVSAAREQYEVEKRVLLGFLADYCEEVDKAAVRVSESERCVEINIVPC
jgi:myosin heavy subunit